MRVVLHVFFLLIVHTAYPQYFQYSQYNFNEQRINPAMTGMSRYASVSVDFRNQKTGGGFPINSSFMELNYPLLNSSTGQPWSGVGISLQDDRAGGIYKTQEVALSYAIHLRVAQLQMLSFGAKFLNQTSQVSLDNFYTGAQYVPDRGFDLAAGSGENFSTYRHTINTFSMGMYWRQTDKNGRLLHHFGVSFFDINKPPDSFFGNTGTLPSTLIINAGFEAFSRADLHVFPEALFTSSASTSMLNAGLRFQKELNPKPKKVSDRVELLTKYAVGRSGIVGLQLHRENFSMGISYDFPVFYANPGNLGALEVGLTVRKLVPTHSQKITARRKKAADERKRVVAEKQKIKDQKTGGSITSKTTGADSTVAITKMDVVEKKSNDSTEISASAEAGRLKQDPLVIEKVTLHFSFEFNSTDLDDSAEDFLDQLTTTLRENDGVKVMITGYTDNIGSEKFNVRLSQKRADAVRQFLLKSGIESTRLTSEGKGMGNPLNGNQTDADRAQNRRVEITLHY